MHLAPGSDAQVVAFESPEMLFRFCLIWTLAGYRHIMIVVGRTRSQHRETGDFLAANRRSD